LTGVVESHDLKVLTTQSKKIILVNFVANFVAVVAVVAVVAHVADVAAIANQYHLEKDKLH
jgi:hypothetical protein